MKEFRNGSDMASFKKADVLELIQQLDAPHRKMLKMRLASIDEHSKTFFTIRSWVLRKFYPEKFKRSVPFYEELKDILSLDE